MGMVQWLTMARVVRSEVLSIREKDYITAARSIGAGKMRILFRHILPNIADTVLVYATFTIPMVIIEDAFLSFLGLGVPAPMASLGTLIKDGIPTLGVYPWQLLFPALVLLLLVFLVNSMGWALKKKMGI
jgi:oligopeptide transport system permease protein